MTEKMFTCAESWQCGEFEDGALIENWVYPSLKAFKMRSGHQSCGVVELEVRFVRLVPQEELDLVKVD